MPQKIILADSQILNTVQLCSRKYEYSFLRDLDPILKPDYFEKGDLLHKMLQVYYNLRKYRIRWSLNSSKSKKIESFTHADIVDICAFVGNVYARRMQLDLEDVENVIVAFRGYCTYRSDDGWDRILAVEQTGLFELFENEEWKILYQVKIDLILELVNVPIMPVDHKSVGKRQSDVIGPDGSTFNQQQLSNQFLGYTKALGTNNIIKNDVGFQKTLKPPEKFVRHLLSYTNDSLQEWVAESAWWLIRAAREQEIGLYPRNLTSCDKYGGCIFRYVCKSDRVLREEKLNILTEKRKHWDVGADLR
jgi:hypothetical protein